MTYIKELRNYFKFDNKLSRFRGPTHKSHYAKQARYALYCAIYERCSWVGSETNYMDLLRNEEMQKCSDKYSIKELEEAYLAGLGKTGSGYGVIGG